MNGSEATKAIRKLKNGKATNIIGLSANALGGDDRKAQQAGMDSYMSKPVKIEDLAEKIKDSFEAMKHL